MSKIICEICGTSYQESAQCCPICGYAMESAEDYLEEDLLNEDEAVPFAAKKKEIFDFDEVNAESEDEEYIDDEDEETYEESYAEEDDDEDRQPNTLLVILLTVIIAGLLVAAGFIFFRFFLPSRNKAEATQPVQTMAVAEQLLEESTEPTIPCETLIISSGMVAELNAEGQHFLLHIKAMPENTTDKILYVSGDESIATVTEDGRITAVSEGETKIYITCGKSSIECPVIIRYVEETVPPTTEAVVVDETEPAIEETESAEENTTPVVEAVDPDQPNTPAVSTQIKPGITLKLKKTDIRLGVYYQYTLVLDCDLQQNEVQWSSEHPHIAKVDENGVVTAVKSGTTAITATYGDQSVTCMVRCG